MANVVTTYDSGTTLLPGKSAQFTTQFNQHYAATMQNLWTATDAAGQEVLLC